ncbi:MAG: hypothetical protein HDKAJFGB_03960 [Anaerolineae bacterium]|nr:hypothetical protein [Anaerolineae bacterium]
MIGNYAHGVERLARAAGGNDNAFARERSIARENLMRARRNFMRLCHAPLALGARSQMARARFDNKHTASFERCKIFLRRGIFPHARLHRGREQNRRARIQNKRANDIIRQTVREFRQRVGGRRRNDDELRALGERHMLDFRIGGERQDLAQRRIVRERGERERTHKLRGGIRQSDMHIRAALMQFTRQRRAFVGGDAAGDAE